MNPLRIAVIGAGHLGRIHAKLLRDVPGTQLVAVVDPVEGARTNVAAECGVAAVADYRDVPGGFDAAVVATPTRFHHAVSLDLLRQGVPLLIEKPLAATLAEADELVAAAESSGAVLQVGHIERFNPGLKSVLPHIRAPKYIEAARWSGYTFRSTDIGVVLDLMIHDLDVILSLVRSPVRSVDALGLAVMGGHEDVAQARLHFENGCVANLSASRVSYQPMRQMQIWSAEGFASVDFATRKSTLVRPSEALQQGFNGDALSAERKAHLKDHLFEELLPKTQIEADATNAIADELREFAESIRERRAPRVTGQDGRNAMAVAEQILTAIGLHDWNGQSSGLVGPTARPPQPILRGPHWARQDFQRVASDLGIQREAS